MKASMKNLALAAVIAGLLLGAIFGARTITADLSDSDTIQSSPEGYATDCSACPNPYDCTPDDNCGRPSCGALQGSPCGCGG